jgi:lipopolysaccharide/colanic/teichoic acid biosynthesis glycosyltransferase
MTIYSRLRRFLHSRSANVPPAVAGLCGPEEFEKALRRERSRADRTSDEFAVITFSSADPSGNSSSLYPLIEHLQGRSRSIDELGWSHDGSLWHILPHCSEQAAASIATTLCKNFSSENSPVVYTLYHYSADESGLPAAVAASREVAVPAAAAVSAASTSVSNGTKLQNSSALRQPVAPGDSTNRKSAFSIDSLLERPMPRWKRCFDIVASATALILLSPLLVMIAACIKWTSPGPVLFVQLRSGRGGRPFRMYKFRSMVADAEEKKRGLLTKNEQDGPAFKMENDPRITHVGRFLRASSLDELPQLWNVLQGEMSLVGPRPLPLSESAACENWQRQRLDVTPGLTCFWQIKDRRAKIPFVDWARMDIQYAGRRSLGLDLYLIARTVMFVLRRKGV